MKDDRSIIPASDKKSYISSMFDSIAVRYDFLNHFLSAGTDRYWRRKAIAQIGKHKKNPSILDVATGTGDLALAALRLDPVNVTGIDISDGMLEIGYEKIKKLGLEHKINLIPGDSESIPFSDGSFDVSMVAFGVRNFSDPGKGLEEMRRVLKNNGMIMVLEFSRPSNVLFRSLFYLYFRKVLPFFGRMISGDREAYTYLPESVIIFPDNQEFLDLMLSAGFTGVKQTKLTGGIASIYTGFKGTAQ
jgi:demethylmenaquinone methyltransferase/2-methoxy-6-polyprenyl-1,4-benzoquinol methylase